MSALLLCQVAQIFRDSVCNPETTTPQEHEEFSCAAMSFADLPQEMPLACPYFRETARATSPFKISGLLV